MAREINYVRRASMRPVTFEQIEEYAKAHNVSQAVAMDRLNKDRAVESCLNAKTVDELKGVVLYILGRMP